MILSAITEQTVLNFKKLLSNQLPCNTSLYLPSCTFILDDLSLYSVTVSYTTTTIPSGVVPDYATGCAGCKAYAHACSCWGITSTVINAPTPTRTVMVTVTEYSPCGATTPSKPYDCEDPKVCGSLDFIEDDQCGDEGQCACTYDLSGRAVCVEDVDCDAADTCDDDVDCDGNQICWRYSCCETNVCTNPSEVCGDTDSARLGFHGGQKVLLPTGVIGEI